VDGAGETEGEGRGGENTWLRARARRWFYGLALLCSSVFQRCSVLVRLLRAGPLPVLDSGR
jgi:hypothetical protein